MEPAVEIILKDLLQHAFRVRIWAILMLAMFAIGFSLPLGAVLLGISLSKVSLAARGADVAIRWIAGVVLVIAGFYFLVTF